MYNKKLNVIKSEMGYNNTEIRIYLPTESWREKGKEQQCV